MRRLGCLLLAALLVCVPGGTQPTYAGKKRREASIDRLRDRSPSERWKSLQQLWNPFDEGATAGESAAGSEGVTTDLPNTGGNVAGTSTQDESTTPVSAQPAPPVVFRPTELRPPHPTATRTAGPRSPVRVIDAARDRNPAGLSSSANGTVMTSLQADSRAGSGRGSLEEASDWKDIGKIDPFYYYIPKETRDTYSSKELNEPELRQELCMDGDGDGLNCPKLLPLPTNDFEERSFAETYVAWEPTNLFSNPLYFEDASLERYGHTHGCLQPIVSLGKFSAQLVGLPYQMALHPIHEHRYALGWYRPGECAPKKYYLPPWNTKAAISAGAVYTGLIFVIP